jgi:signal transduction histidine kinase
VSRRFWPAALAAASILVLGSYLVYTSYLVRQIRRESAIHAEIYSIVQRGLLSDVEGGPLAALVDMQDQLQRLDVPIVYFSAAGDPSAANNLPFDWDLSTPDGRRRVREYAAQLAADRPGNVIVQPGVGEIYFGDPPILSWLRWVPYLQVGAGVLLVLVAFVIMRADMRAHRERLWSAMARELAHQMGTPLSSLSGWIEVLELSAEEREGVPPERIARMMQADVERLERVSRRFELVGKKPALEPVPAADIVAELVSYYRPRLPQMAHGIVLRSRVQPNLPVVHVNRVLLVWALENIVKNAIDALAGRGGHISVIARRDEKWLQLIIADDGPGIAPKLRERIFEPGVSTKAAGWGVGLSLSRRIVEELHQGRITVHSRRAGGSVFGVMLPVTDT